MNLGRNLYSIILNSLVFTVYTVLDTHLLVFCFDIFLSSWSESVIILFLFSSPHHSYLLIEHCGTNSSLQGAVHYFYHMKCIFVRKSIGDWLFISYLLIVACSMSFFLYPLIEVTFILLLPSGLLYEMLRSTKVRDSKTTWKVYDLLENTIWFLFHSLKINSISRKISCKNRSSFKAMWISKKRKNDIVLMVDSRGIEAPLIESWDGSDGGSLDWVWLCNLRVNSLLCSHSEFDGLEGLSHVIEFECVFFGGEGGGSGSSTWRLL